METVNEELRSTNEELQATNDQLRRQERQLGSTNAFLNAIVSTLRVGVAVVGEDLTVRVWNQLAAELWGLRGDEVVGSSFATLDIGLPVDSLIEPIRQCLAESGHDGHPHEILVDAINRRGRELRCRILLTRLASTPGSEPGVCVLMEDVESRHRGREANR